MQRPCDTVTLVGVPYSEHSSWLELRQCVGRLRPKRLVPTVNAVNRSQQDALVDRFADLMDLSACRSRIDAYLVRPAASKASPVGACACTAADDAATTAAKPVQAGVGAVPCSAAAGADAVTPVHSGLEPSLFSTGSPSSKDSSDTVVDLTGPPAASEPQPHTSDAAQGLGQQQGQPAQDEGFDFDSVDVSEQLRLLEDAARRHRLKKSVSLQAAANSKQQQRKRARQRKVDQGVLQPATLKKGGKQQKLV